MAAAVQDKYCQPVHTRIIVPEGRHTYDGQEPIELALQEIAGT